MIEDDPIVVDPVDALVDDLHGFVRQSKYERLMLSQVVASLELVKYQLLEAWHHTR